MKKLLFALCLATLSVLAFAAPLNDFRIGWPYPGEMSRESGAATGQIETQNEAVAGCFTLHESVTITSAGFVNGSVTGTAASIADNSYTLSIQLPGATGTPSGTPVGGASPASATFPTSGQAGGVTLGTTTTHVLTLSNPAVLSAGTLYCMVIQHTGATDVTNNITVRYGYTPQGVTSLLPYTATADATPTWTKSTSLPIGMFLRSASKSYVYPFVAIADVTVTNLAERGFAFTLPSVFGTSATYKVCGVRVQVSAAAPPVGGSFVATLYSTPTTSPVAIQQSALVDSDALGSTGPSSGRGYRFDFPSTVSLSPGIKYGLAVAASASGFGLHGFSIPTSGDGSAYSLNGMTYLTRALTDYPPSGNDTNVFTETATTLMSAELVMCDFTPAVGGSGFMRLR